MKLTPEKKLHLVSGRANLPLAEEIARKAMKIAGDICIYTNDQVVLESL